MICPKCKKKIKPIYKDWCLHEYMGYVKYCPKCKKAIESAGRRC